MRTVRSGGWSVCAALVAGLLAAGWAGAAWAELQNLEVGGEMRTRGRYYRNVFVQGFQREVRVPDAFLLKRPIGPLGVSSLFKWDDEGPDWGFAETSILLHVDARFTDDVSAYVELYDYHQWGTDFRSDYRTGADFRAVSVDDTEFNQAYVEMREVMGMPLRLRIGRQELKFGKGWLVSNMLTPTQHLSFDAVRATWARGDWTLDAFTSKLNESGIVEADGDVDFHGVHGAWAGLEPLDLSAYWFWVRDSRSLADTNFVAPLEWLEDAVGLDDYDVTNLHTVGLRAHGRSGNVDYDLELAYQFGEADAYGVGFAPAGFAYGDTGAKFDNWAGELTVGYTFADLPWSPRVYARGVYFGGEDNRDISFLDWLNPFYRPESSVSFNRLFTDINYMPTVNDNGWMSNFWQASVGVDAQPRDNIRLHFEVAHDRTVEPFAFPAHVTIGGYNVPIAPWLSFWTEECSCEIGWETAFWVKYDYSDDLWFLLYWNHLFVGDGLADGSFTQFNGTDFDGGTDDDDADYVFVMSVLRF